MIRRLLLAALVGVLGVLLHLAATSPAREARDLHPAIAPNVSAVPYTEEPTDG